MRIITLLLCTITSAFAVEANGVIKAAPFQSTNGVTVEGTGIGYINKDDWVRYDNLNFTPDARIEIRVKASAPDSGGGTIQVIHGNSLAGPVIATVPISGTGGFGNYGDFLAGIEPSFNPISGHQNTIFLKFQGGSGFLMNVAEFSFTITNRSLKSDILASNFMLESNSADPSKIDRNGSNLINITNGSWADYGQFDFGSNGMAYAWIEASATAGTPSGTSRIIRFRTGSKDAAPIGSVVIPDTGGLFKPFGIKIPSSGTGPQRLFLTFEGGSGELFKISKFRFQRLAPDHQPTGPITARIERDVVPWTNAKWYDLESHPVNNPSVVDWIIRRHNDGVGFISADTWVRYENHNIPVGANRVSIQAYAGTGDVEVYLAPNGATTPTGGTSLATFTEDMGGNENNVPTFTRPISTSASGPQNIFFKFSGNLDFVRFRFDAHKDHTFAGSYPEGSGVTKQLNDSNVINVTHGGWARYNGVVFGENANMITVTAATAGKGGRVNVHLDSQSGEKIAEIDVTHTGNLGHFREYHAALTRTISGSQTLYLKFEDPHNQGGTIFNLKDFVVTKKTSEPAPTGVQTLNVYPMVTGLNQSPYYTYSVQREDVLNDTNKQFATNWLTPFAWFTECRLSGESYSGGYYKDYIGGWSHTYCNFEMSKNTKIVVKIKRNENSPHGAPKGKIFMANAHPAHKVESCEIINGEVYVTMKEPALVTVDIDGQMDTRDVIGAYASKENGSHAVSIFANPVISDKPLDHGDDSILYIEPGTNDVLTKVKTSNKKLVYFKPGVHSFSGFTNGQPNKYEPGHEYATGTAYKASDEYKLSSDKTIYIPGNAIVYGNFNGAKLSNVRIYGHGTISGRFIPHNADLSWAPPYGNYPYRFELDENGKKIKEWGWDWETLPDGTKSTNKGNMYGVEGVVLRMDEMVNCRFEGVTLADPANHGIKSDHGSDNIRSWIKQISWRRNNDMGGLPGTVEDCFFRLQDDGLYVSQGDFRRNVLWFDVNGMPFRSSLINSNSVSTDNQALVQDCDVIYMRSKFNGEGIAMVSARAGDFWQEPGTFVMKAPYTGTVRNTAQHVIFRNIRVTDPRPERSLFEFDVKDEKKDSQGNPTGYFYDPKGGISGIRFENFEVRHPYPSNLKNELNAAGSLAKDPSDPGPAISSYPSAPIAHLHFEGVSIDGMTLTSNLFGNTSMFQITGPTNSNTFVFNNAPPTVRPLASPTGGTINILAGQETILNFDNPQNTYTGDGRLRVSSNGTDHLVELAKPPGVANPTNFALSGAGKIIIDGSATLQNGGWQKGVWNGNLADMDLHGTLDLWDGNPVFVDSLSGAGSVSVGYGLVTDAHILNVGINNGTMGNFSGVIQESGNFGFIRLVKKGTGKQTLSNLAIQKPKEIWIEGGTVELSTNANVTLAANISGAGNLIKTGTGTLKLTGSVQNIGNIIINGGAVELSNSTDVTLAAKISGAGNLIKSGAGTLTLSGAVENTGEIKVDAGILKVSNGLGTQSKLTVMLNAKVDLGGPFGTSRVMSLNLGNSGALANGFYGPTHSTYGGYFVTGSTGIEISSLPLLWRSVDIGTGLAGSASFNSDTFIQTGAGLAAAQNTRNDRLRFSYQWMQGDGHIIARIISSAQPYGSAGSARIGVMIRRSLGGGSMHAFIGINEGHYCRWARRTTTDDTNISSSVNGTSPPNIWVKLERTGNTINAFTSATNNFVNAIPVGTLDATNFEPNCYIGLVVSSGSETTINTSQFSEVTVSP